MRDKTRVHFSLKITNTKGIANWNFQFVDVGQSVNSSRTAACSAGWTFGITIDHGSVIGVCRESNNRKFTGYSLSFQFTVCCSCSLATTRELHWSTFDAHTTHSAFAACHFYSAPLQRLPFSIKCLQFTDLCLRSYYCLPILMHDFCVLARSGRRTLCQRTTFVIICAIFDGGARRMH